jgi:hypothetical protein
MKVVTIKRMSKVVLSFAIFVGLICLSPATTLADTSSDKVDSIINTGILSTTKASLLSDQGTEYAVDIFETAEQLVSIDFHTNTGSYMKEYAFVLDKNNMVLRSSAGNNSDIVDTNDIVIQGAGSKTDEEWDASGGVKGTVTIYYDRQGTLYKITRATGTWMNYDAPGTTLSNHKAIIACNEGFDSSQFIQRNVDSGSFDINTGFTQYADSSAGICSIGANSIVTINRPSGHSWELITHCQIAGTMPSPN